MQFYLDTRVFFWLNDKALKCCFPLDNFPFLYPKVTASLRSSVELHDMLILGVQRVSNTCRRALC